MAAYVELMSAPRCRAEPAGRHLARDSTPGPCVAVRVHRRHGLSAWEWAAAGEVHAGQHPPAHGAAIQSPDLLAVQQRMQVDNRQDLVIKRIKLYVYSPDDGILRAVTQHSTRFAYLNFVVFEPDRIV
nr:hypothetical protein [Zoogloeaceae bacterium]